jgi:hypothetical protein
VEANEICEASKSLAPGFTGEQSRHDTTVRSVNYFFDQPSAIRRPANNTPTNYVPVLATFDADNAVILANRALLRAVERNWRAQHRLCDEDVETLAHEFASVLQYRDIFEDHVTPSDRIEALRKRSSRIVLRSTIESYTNHRLLHERQAKEVAQRVRMETLNSFDRTQHGSGLSSKEITEKVEELAADLVRDLRQDFISTTRREFARLRNHQGNDSHPTNAVEYASDGTRYENLSVHKLRWLFPLEQSATVKRNPHNFQRIFAMPIISDTCLSTFTVFHTFGSFVANFVG